jgi:hypothetical protein
MMAPFDLAEGRLFDLAQGRLFDAEEFVIG